MGMECNLEAAVTQRRNALQQAWRLSRTVRPLQDPRTNRPVPRHGPVSGRGPSLVSAARAPTGSRMSRSGDMNKIIDSAETGRLGMGNDDPTRPLLDDPDEDNDFIRHCRHSDLEPVDLC